MKTNPRALVLVTGSTEGIGAETARQLALRGADVIVHGRNPAKVAAAHEALCRATGRDHPAPLSADLTRLADIRAMVGALEQRGDRLTALVNNAGGYFRQRELTVDGFEASFMLGHLAPFLLTHLIVDGSAGARVERIVNVSSIAHLQVQLDLSDLRYSSRVYNAYRAYSAAKLAQVLFTVEAARRLAMRDIAVNAVHPGVVATGLTLGLGMKGKDSLEQGAAMQVKLAFDEEYRHVTGRYFSVGQEAAMNACASDESLARTLFEQSADLVHCVPFRAAGDAVSPRPTPT